MSAKPAYWLCELSLQVSSIGVELVQRHSPTPSSGDRAAIVYERAKASWSLSNRTPRTLSATRIWLVMRGENDCHACPSEVAPVTGFGVRGSGGNTWKSTGDELNTTSG